MGEYSEKKFYFSGDFSFFSDEQRDDALKFHGGVLVDTLKGGVDYIVDGGGKVLTSEQKKSATVLSELDFTTKLIFTSYPSEESVDENASATHEDCISVEIDIGNLRDAVNAIEEGVIYSCVFIYPKEDGENPVIRSFFSYLKSGEHILFSCRGLTDDSSDMPLTQFGLLDMSSDVMAAAFEAYDESLVRDELYIAKADNIDGEGFYDAIESERPLKLSKKSMLALERLNAFQGEHYFIDDSDEGYYRLTDAFYKKHKKILLEDESWIQEGFCSEVYRAAESVLKTGGGWLL